MKKATIAILITAIIFVFVSSVFSQEKAGGVLKELERKEITPKAPSKPVIEKEKIKEEVLLGEKAGGKISVREINVEGATIIDSKTIKSIISPYENKELSIDEINFIAKAITKEYRKRGYITAYAYVPPQEIKDGILKIKVVEGKVGNIEISGNKHYTKEFIQGHLERTRKDPSLNEKTLERALLILNEFDGLWVQASIRAGKEPGTTDIFATVKDRTPISGSITYDNFGSKTISKSRLGLNLNFGNLLTTGDYLRLRGLTGLDRIDLKRLSYGRVEYQIPVDCNGTKFGAYYTNSIYKAGEDYAILDIHGKAHVAGLYITHPLVKQMGRDLSIRIGFDYKDAYDYMLGAKRAEDNIRVVNVGLTYDFADRLHGRNIIALNYYQGIRDILGGNGKNDPNTSRLNADGKFSKVTLDLMRVQGITEWSNLILKGSGQLSGDALFSAEQFYIGGAQSVRGFRSSLYGGDSGYLLNAELQIAPLYRVEKIKDSFKVMLFADHGGVYRNKRQPGEDKSDYLTSIGAGAGIQIGRHISARIDWGVPKIRGKFNSRNSETYLQGTISF